MIITVHLIKLNNFNALIVYIFYSIVSYVKGNFQQIVERKEANQRWKELEVLAEEYLWV